MMAPRQPETFPPVTLGPIRSHGCRDLLVYCESGWCHRSAVMNADWLPDEIRLRSRMAELREEFDYVLIDAPPVCSYADAVLLGQLADGVILVVEANSTRRDTARMAKETIEGAKVRLLGAVLNNRTFPIPEALYRKL